MASLATRPEALSPLTATTRPANGCSSNSLPSRPLLWDVTYRTSRSGPPHSASATNVIGISIRIRTSPLFGSTFVIWKKETEKCISLNQCVRNKLRGVNYLRHGRGTHIFVGSGDSIRNYRTFFATFYAFSSKVFPSSLHKKLRNAFLDLICLHVKNRHFSFIQVDSRLNRHTGVACSLIK